MNRSKDYPYHSGLIPRLVFTGLLLILLYRLVGNTLMTGLENPPYIFPDSETFYRLYHSIHVSQFITSSFLCSTVFDVLLFLFPLAFIITLNRIFAIGTTILLLVYFLTFNMVTGHHYHSLVGAIVITIPFWFKKPARFFLAWEGVRYYWLYIFASAALWKILRGSAFYADQLSNTLKSQQLDLLLWQPDSLHAQVVKYLIVHPQVSHLVLLANVALQLFFIVGFFTKKFDFALFWLAILFCIANYYVMSIVSAELLILNLTLFTWRRFKVEEIKHPMAG